MGELHHECGVAAVYHLPNQGQSPFSATNNPELTSRLIPRLLLEIQNRGQLAAGMTVYNPNTTAEKRQLLATHKDVGSVNEVFRLNKSAEFERLMQDYSGIAAIGHVRYATCGNDDRGNAQPFERHHIERSKWFSFAFNGQLANYKQLKAAVLEQEDFHLTRDTDTEILMHHICMELAGNKRPTPEVMLANLAKVFDGAYNIVYLNARGDMIVARDPLGIRPLCYAQQGPLFAAASESVALDNLGFEPESIKNLEPGHAVIIQDGELRKIQFAESPRHAHCFFEWIYFANVASSLDERSVYLSRKRLGEELARLETLQIDRAKQDTIVVPVPDTAKAAADSFAFRMGIPSMEGLMRNRYVGRTFIEGRDDRANRARTKYTPLRDVLSEKRILLVEDTIVRSTTMRTLISQLRKRGNAAEVHVRVACPPILAPCFYGIDMSRVDELFATKYLSPGQVMTRELEEEMARELGADSLRYLPLDSIARCVDLPAQSLCQACLDGKYPTEAGIEMYQLALEKSTCKHRTENVTRTYD